MKALKWEKAEQLAEEVKGWLAPYCSMIEVVGSIRRRCPTVNDIDLVAKLSDPIGFNWEIQKMRRAYHQGCIKPLDGSKIKRFKYKGVQVDIYTATPQTWATLLLIRTGSTQHNIKLCALAKVKGWMLKADGSGLFNEAGERIAGDSEESIFKALGLPFIPPMEREP